MERAAYRPTFGNLNRDIKAANPHAVYPADGTQLKGVVSGLKEKKAALLEALEQAKEPTIPELLSRYLDMRSEERTGWTSKGKLKGTVGDFNKVMEALDFLREKEISTVESLDAYLDTASGQAVSIREEIRPMEKRMKEIDRLLFHIGNFEANKPVHAKYAAIRWKKPKEKFAADHKDELDAYNAALRISRFILMGRSTAPKSWPGNRHSFQRISLPRRKPDCRTGGCKDFAGCAPLAQSGFSIRAVPPDRRAGQETIHPAGSQRPGTAYPGGTGRETPATPPREKTGYGTLTNQALAIFPVRMTGAFLFSGGFAY